MCEKINNIVSTNPTGSNTSLAKDEPQSLDTPTVQLRPASEGTRLGFDYLDAAVREELLAPFKSEKGTNQIRNAMVGTANDLAEEGSGPALWRLMSKEIALRRVSLRQSDLVLAQVREKFRTDSNYDVRRLQAAERSAAGEHRRLLDSLELFDRISNAANPTVHIHSFKTEIAIESDQ